MAVQLKFSRTGINADAAEMYISDITGDYDVVDNPTGWGAPNPERSEKALIGQAFLHKSDSDVGVELVSYDPETVSNFTLLCPEDGYYELIVASVDDSIPTVELEYGWSISSGLVQLVEGSLIPKTPKDLLEVEGQTVTSFKTVLLGRLAIYRNSKNLELVKLKIAKVDDRAHNREIADLDYEFNFVRGLLDGAKYQWCIDNYTQAQTIVEAFNNLVNEQL